MSLSKKATRQPKEVMHPEVMEDQNNERLTVKKARPSAAGKKTICVFLKDSLGSIHTVLSLDRTAVVEAVYVTTKGILQIVLRTKHMEGRTELKWAPVQTGKVNKETGKVDVHNTGGVKEVKLYNAQDVHNTVDFDDEDEIRYIWEWLDNGMSADELFLLRAASLKELEDFKAKKLEEAKQKEEEAKNQKPVEGEQTAAEIMEKAKEQEQATIQALKKTTPVGTTGMKKVV